jgi:integrase
MRKRRGRGEGSIFFRATDSTWVGSISLGYDGTGKRRRRTVYGKTKQEVQESLRKLQSDYATGKLADATKMPVGEYLQRWLEHTVAERARATTLERYEQLVRLHLEPLLGHVALSALRPIHVEGALSTLKVQGVGARTRQHAATVLKAALAHAQRLQMVPNNAATAVAKPRPQEREMQSLTPEQARALLDCAGGLRLYPLVAVALASGARQGELFALYWEDVDLERGTIRISRSLAQGKGGPRLAEVKTRQSRRTVTLPRWAVEALSAHRLRMDAEGHGSPLVFCSEAGTPLLKSNFLRRVFRPLAKRAGLAGLRFHDLRHSHASILLSQGASLKAVSQRLGHANPTMTLRVYAHVLPADDAALAGRLEGLLG